jgi:glycosyltransferase involved in cell wall biosynthesis
MTNTICLNEKYSTTRLVTREKPEVVNSPEDKFETVLFLPEGEGRKGEGGLRTKGYFKKSHQNKPLISIITAVFNGEKFLEETIQSIINQTYDNVEYIIIDGGSSDGTLDIIKKYEDRIDYWVSERDRGISDAFNKGVLASRGDYVYFLGADDYFIAVDAIEKMMIDVDPSKDDLVCGNVERVDMSGKTFSKTDVVRFKKQDLLFRMAIPHQGLFMHRRFFDRYGLFDVNNKFSMDYELLLRAYHNFPDVTMKDIEVAAWRDGGCGTGRFLEIFEEYHQNRAQNKVAPKLILDIIHLWTLAKFYIKRAIGGKI